MPIRSPAPGTIAGVRILHTSDWHVGRTMRGQSRAAEHQAVLADLARQAGALAVDVIIVAGDIFDLSAPTPESEQIVYRALLDLAEVAPVVAVAGNHDNPRRLLAVAPLLDLGRVVMVTSVARPDEGGLVEVAGLPLRVAAVPWQSQRGIVSADDLMNKDAFEHAQDYAARMGRILSALCGPMGTDTVNVLAGHMMVHGGEATGSERAIQTMFEYSIPAGQIPGSLSYAALGHLHRRQRVPGSAPVWYSGSLLQLDFGEAGDAKGAVLVEVEPGLPATVSEVTIGGGRPLVKLAGSLEQVVAAAVGLEDSYIKVELDEKTRVGLSDEVRSAIPGVVDIVLRTADGPDKPSTPIRLGRPPVELFEEYLAARRRSDPRLVELFGALLEEVDET